MLAPSEMVSLLARRIEQQLARRRVAGEGRLAVIERLRGDLAAVIDAHQGRRLAPLRGVERRLGQRRARVLSGGGGRSEHGFQGPIEGDQGGIERIAIGLSATHGTLYDGVFSPNLSLPPVTFDTPEHPPAGCPHGGRAGPAGVRRGGFAKGGRLE